MTSGRLGREFINGPCYCGLFNLEDKNGIPFKNQPCEMKAGGKRLMTSLAMMA